MNRIPNYRIWHKFEKRFVDLRSIDFEKENIGYDAYREGNYYDIASFKDIVFQQWTGEFDKNKKEIYEGDIVRVTSEEWSNENFLAEVIFSEASFLSKIDDNDIRGLWGGVDIEVIGNIFELPCKPDHNGECLVCDEPLDGCPFNKEPEYHLSAENNEWLKKKKKAQEELQKLVKQDPMWQKPLSIADPKQ